MSITNPPLVTKLLLAAVAAARNSHRDVLTEWISISFNIGGRLPKSLLPVQIQRSGEIDLVARALEDEALGGALSDDEMIFAANIGATYAELWVHGAYAIAWLLKHRDLVTDEERAGGFDALFGDLERVRVALEKHELRTRRTRFT